MAHFWKNNIKYVYYSDSVLSLQKNWVVVVVLKLNI